MFRVKRQGCCRGSVLRAHLESLMDLKLAPMLPPGEGGVEGLCHLHDWRNLEGVADGELGEEADQAPSLGVAGLVDRAEALHLFGVRGGGDGEAGGRLLGQEDPAFRPATRIEAIAEVRGVLAADGLVAVDRGADAVHRRVAAHLELGGNQLAEHLAQEVARLADGGHETQTRLEARAGILAGALERTDDLAAEGDLALSVGQAQLTLRGLECRAMLSAPSPDADLA